MGPTDFVIQCGNEIATHTTPRQVKERKLCSKK